jgi:hypothetical protein
MPRVLIIPFNQVEKVCQDAMTFANACQNDFTFYVLPSTKYPILINHTAEVFDILEFLDKQKEIAGYETDDLMLCFYDGILKATDHGLSNLFCAGSRYDEKYPCTGVISLKYLGWDILEERYNYDLQKHSILHLIVCGMIGGYTKLQAHNDIGCLLDLNLRLNSFNLKLKRGYYLCSSNEFGCYDNMREERYGRAIIKMCEAFKVGNYQVVVKELIMGDKFENIQHSTIYNRSTFTEAFNIIKTNYDEDAAQALEIVKSLVEKSENKEAGELFDSFNEEIQKEKPKKSVLASLWDGLTKIVPLITQTVGLVDKITPLFHH